MDRIFDVPVNYDLAWSNIARRYELRHSGLTEQNYQTTWMGSCTMKMKLVPIKSITRDQFIRHQEPNQRCGMLHEVVALDSVAHEYVRLHKVLALGSVAEVDGFVRSPYLEDNGRPGIDLCHVEEEDYFCPYRRWWQAIVLMN